MSISSLFNMGWNSLSGAQSAIQTTGNNISNVNTDGYSRQEVRFDELSSLDRFPGQMGQGAYAAEVVRHFNKYIEASFLDKNSSYERWDTQYSELQSVESLFNEANGQGINSALTKFFSNWQELAKRPDDKAVREALLAQSDTLAKLIRETDGGMLRLQQEIDQQIKQDVDEVNNILRTIADLNRQINVHDDPGKNNANSLFDQRDKLVRKLSEKLDVTVVDNGGGSFTVNTKGGQTLVDGTEAFELDFAGPRYESDLVKRTPPAVDFDGKLQFEGTSSSEYTMEVVAGGAVGTATYRVSLDGGKTWLKDKDGKDQLFTTQASPASERVKDLDISFSGATQPLMAGDRFTIAPKSALYWVTPTRDPLNITPLAQPDGTDMSGRLTGGSLGALFTVRDEKIGEYRDKLDTFAKTLIWEVNRIHSQGTSMEKLVQMAGTDKVGNAGVPLGQPSSGLNFYDRLQSGNITLHLYNKDSGTFNEAKSIAFDKDTDSLETVVGKINAEFAGQVKATIKDGTLVLEAEGNTSFAFGTDSSGLMAALGLNTFFQGAGSTDFSLKPELRQNVGLINTSAVNGASETNSGDNSTALGIAGLASKKIEIASGTDRSVNQTISEYYSSLVAVVGSDTAEAKFNTSYYKSMAQDLDDRQSSISGVNLDEEMATLIKFQHSYKAAAKLVTTADEMFQVLLGLKQ